MVRLERRDKHLGRPSPLGFAAGRSLLRPPSAPRYFSISWNITEGTSAFPWVSFGFPQVVGLSEAGIKCKKVVVPGGIVRRFVVTVQLLSCARRFVTR